MAEQSSDSEESPQKNSKLPMVIGVCLALIGGGGGFFAVYSGMILGPPQEAAKPEDTGPNPIDNLAFVEVDPMVISIGAPSAPQQLRFRTSLEVASAYREDVEKLMPRVMDVMNGYLRALEIEDFQERGIMDRIRSNLLRRIQIVTGEGRVNDLLIMEFVVN